MDRTVLIGLHHPLWGDTFSSIARSHNWKPEVVNDLESMLKRVKLNKYGLYVMDANLGLPNSPDCTPAREVYNVLKKRAEGKQAVFYAISANRDAIANCREEKIPAMFRTDFRLQDYLK